MAVLQNPPRHVQTRLDQLIEATRIYPLGAYDCVREPGWALLPRAKNEVICFFVRAGAAEMRIDDGEIKHRAIKNDLVFIPRAARMSIQAEEHESFRFQTLHFNASVYGGIDLLELLGLPALLVDGRSTAADGAFNLCVREFALQDAGWKQIMSGRILEVVCMLIRNNCAPRDACSPTPADPRFVKLLPALECIENRLHDSTLAIGDLARACTVSEVYLRRLFREVAGMPPVNFLQRRRVEQACLLLRTTTLGIKQIAQQCGFAELTFFYRVFRTWNKMTPAQYRKGRDM